MKKKLALLLAAIMTVAMVPMTALASTKLTVVDELSVGIGEDNAFVSRVELTKGNDQVPVIGEEFEVKLSLTNGKFSDEMWDYFKKDGEMGVNFVEKVNDTTAILTLDTDAFNGDRPDACVVKIWAYALEEGEVVAKFTSNVPNFTTASDVIATAYTGKVSIESAGVIKFVEDDDDTDADIKEITIKELKTSVLKNPITLVLKGDYKFTEGDEITVSFLNDTHKAKAEVVEDDEIIIDLTKIDRFDEIFMNKKLVDLTISGIELNVTKKTDVGDVAYITVKSKDFDAVKLEVAVMVEEAVTYTVEDKKLPSIWAGANNTSNNTLKVSVDENTGDILNTSRKATFTFPEGIEVKAIDTTGSKLDGSFKYLIEENVVKIWDYSVAEGENKTELDIKFILNAAPTFVGDVTVTLGGEFDDWSATIATVKAPYTIEAKTSEVLIDYRYVPVNDIVITEAEDGILEEDDVIVLAVEKMDFEDAGKVEITEGDIEVDVEVDEIEDSKYAYLIVTVKDDSTEASTFVISGLELYLDRTLPVGGYELVEEKFIAEENDKDDFEHTILWDNSSADKDVYDEETVKNKPANGMFKYEAIVVNDSYVEVVTQARDQDDYSTSKKIVITIGAPTMTVGTQVINLVTPAYINAENFTELPVRAISEAFGADVLWDAATKTVTVMMGQRIVSMTIGGRTMYINGTPVAMSTAPEITNDFTFVPVRDLANALGISKIDWNAAASTVTLN